MYTLKYNAKKIFSNKASHILFDKEDITINTLWLNDEVKLQGNFNLKSQKAKIKIDSDSFSLSQKIVDVKSRVHLDTLIENENIDISGKVTLLGGDIHYDLSQQRFASDSDIVVRKSKKFRTKKKPSPFMDKVSLNIFIDSKNPLHYKKGNINLKTKVSLGIQKTINSPLNILGSIELLKGGSYDFEGKKFILNQSFVYFTGAIDKPLLDISVNYQSLNYLITIRLTGMPNSPNIQFSSSPSLSREQILSIILFDSEGLAGTNSGEDMMKMMGGVMAKSALSNLGIELDSLVFGKGNSIEVGKKLSNKMTIIYINDIVSQVKLNYQHGKHTLEANLHNLMILFIREIFRIKTVYA
jgi:translocation and assembly module TamB